MQSSNRIVSLALLGCLCAASPSWAAPFDIFGAVDGQGVDPLVDPYPFFIFPDQSKIALIMFQSDDYAGVVTLQVDCCTDLTGGPVPPPTGVSLQFGGPLMPSSRAAQFSSLQTTGLKKGPLPPIPQNLQPNQFVTAAHETHTPGLHVTTTPDAQTGIFVATVTAAKSDGSSASTRVIINILPTFVESGKTPTCAAFTTNQTAQAVPTGAVSSGSSLIPTDNLGPMALSVFDKKVQNPANTAWGMGYGISNSNGTEGQNVTLSKSALSLTPKQANFVFHNASGYDKQYVLFDTAMCAPSAIITLKDGERASFLASNPTTTTLFFRVYYGKDWKSLAKLSEGTPFWTFFGGKEMDFEWLSENDAMGVTFQ